MVERRNRVVDWLASRISSLQEHPVILILVAILAVFGAFTLTVETIRTANDLIVGTFPDSPTADEWYSTIRDKNLTRSELKTYLAETEGVEVEWRGVVDAAERLFTNNPNSLIYLYLFPIISTEDASRTYAEFPPGATDVLDAKKGDKVSVKCHIAYLSNHRGGRKMHLVDCRPDEFEIL